MSEKLNLDDLDIDSLLDWYEEEFPRKKLRRENPYLADLIRALLPGSSHRSWVISAMEKRRKSVGLDIPPKFENAVQSVYNRHSQDSRVGLPPEHALFYSPQGKGSGYWAVHKDRAAAWLAHLRQKGSL